MSRRSSRSGFWTISRTDACAWPMTTAWPSRRSSPLPSKLIELLSCPRSRPDHRAPKPDDNRRPRVLVRDPRPRPPRLAWTAYAFRRLGRGERRTWRSRSSAKPSTPSTSRTPRGFTKPVAKPSTNAYRSGVPEPAGARGTISTSGSHMRASRLLGRRPRDHRDRELRLFAAPPGRRRVRMALTS